LRVKNLANNLKTVSIGTHSKHRGINNDDFHIWQNDKQEQSGTLLTYDNRQLDFLLNSILQLSLSI